MPNFRAVIMLVYLALFLSAVGCSVGMAMSGKKDPNLGAVRVGATRGEVELQLGTPVSSVTTENGKRLDNYEYEIGNEPSGGRAIGHAAMDVLTLGLWEIIGTPVEGFQGKKYQIAIAYDDNNRVLAINQPVTSVPTTNKEEPKITSQKNAKILQPTISSKPISKETELIEKKLDNIKTLKEKGKISEDEYTQMRKDILKSIR